MSHAEPRRDLPERASLEYLRKLAKERLRELRRTDATARIADAQLAIAREYGFSSWRALKAEIDRRRSPLLSEFFDAVSVGDVARTRRALDQDPTLARKRDARGSTGLHLAVPFPQVVQLLLDRGADPNARDIGDNALALHFAAGRGALESARALVDAGSDVVGAGDVHRLDVIGWATVFDEPRRNIVELVASHGASHHIFSAIALGDRDLVQQVVESNPEALVRRLSRFEQEQTALHYVIAPPDGLIGGTFRTGAHYETLDLLIELGADLEATDARGRTPLAVAMLRGDSEAMRRLRMAGAQPANAIDLGAASFPHASATLRPMLSAIDMHVTVAWYQSIGFTVTSEHFENGRLDWAAMKLDNAELMFVPAHNTIAARERPLSLWIETDRLDEIYHFLKNRQLERSRATLAGLQTELPDVAFQADLHTAFYGQREFCVRDPDGVEVYFAQPIKMS